MMVMCVVHWYRAMSYTGIFVQTERSKECSQSGCGSEYFLIANFLESTYRYRISSGAGLYHDTVGLKHGVSLRIFRNSFSQNCAART